jgi:hypothetical protein
MQPSSLAILAVGVFATMLAADAAMASEPPRLAIAGPAEAVFPAGAGPCDAEDYADAPARAFRAGDGVVLFASHFTTRRAAGAALDRLGRSCAVALGSPGAADPARYLDKRWVAATWTQDGRDIQALVHHEFQAQRHPGACSFPGYMQCWYNTIVAARSRDGGASFAYDAPPRVVAAPPFRQETGQGRHRGFFNPSNIVSDGRYLYTFIHTTGWPGQGYGSCLFRREAAGEGSDWRAWDGRGFDAVFPDPYAGPAGMAGRCLVVQPFSTPVGSVTRLRGSGLWLAVFQRAASADAPAGFYQATSRDLLDWSKPSLLLAAPTLFGSPCGHPAIVAYPALIDPDSPSRNFEDVGSRAFLFYTEMAVEGCRITARRVLKRLPVVLSGAP